MTDIHGCAHLLKQMMRVIDADLARSRPRFAIEVYMSDYVDRGPDSRATLDILINRSRRGNTVFLKGNHEMFLGTARPIASDRVATRRRTVHADVLWADSLAHPWG